MSNNLSNLNYSSSSEKVLYTERSISLSTFLGGPLSATYLIAHNFHEIGKERSFKLTWFIGILSTILIIPLFALVPDRYLPEPFLKLLHFLWLIPVHFIVKNFQQTFIKEHLSSGGKKGSLLNAIFAGIASSILIILYAMYITIPTSNKITDIPQFKESFVQMSYSKCKVYYDSSSISQSDAKVAGVILEKIGYFNPQSNGFEALFYKKEGIYTIAITVEGNDFYSQEIENILKEAITELHKTYGVRKYQFHLLAVDSKGIKNEKIIRLSVPSG